MGPLACWRCRARADVARQGGVAKGAAVRRCGGSLARMETLPPLVPASKNTCSACGCKGLLLASSVMRVWGTCSADLARSPRSPTLPCRTPLTDDGAAGSDDAPSDWITSRARIGGG
jgi:hypothetical protein